MRAMKDCGIPWIGEVPEGWKVMKLRNLGRFSASGIDKKIVDGEPLIRIINYVDIYKNSNKELWEQDYMIVSAPIEKCQEHQVNVGDMFFTPSSETIEDIGVSAVVMESLANTAFSYHIIRFQPTNDIDYRYRKYITNNAICLNYFSSCATGTIRKTISRDIFKECLVLIPPPAEQQRIAEFLDRKCGEVDEMIALQEQIIEELKAYKQSVITEAVTKGLTPEAPMRDSGIEWIGQIPEHWKVQPLKYNFNRRSERNNPILTTERLSLSIDKGVTLYSEKTTNLDRFKEDFTQYQLAYPNDIVLNCMNMIVGAVGLSKYTGCVSPVYYVIYPSNSGISAEYYSYLLNTSTIRGVYYSYGKGIYAIERGEGRVNTCRLKVSYDDFGRFNIPVPPIEEQQKIVMYIKQKCADIDALIATKQQKINSLKEYKRSIIYEYVTGKKEVV